MYQNTARRCPSGAVLVLLSVPAGTEFGIDLHSWNISESFRGVKLIPPGVHLIFCKSLNTTTRKAGSPVGFFYNFTPGEILVKKWSNEDEQLDDEEMTEEQIITLQNHVKALLRAGDKFLVTYPFHIADIWIRMSSNITRELFDRLMPECGKMRFQLELQSRNDANRPRRLEGLKDEPSCSATKKLSGFGEQILPSFEAIEKTELRLTKFPEPKFSAEIRQHFLDSTCVFEECLSEYSNFRSSEIIGELEFCFIGFFIAHRPEAFNQWKKIVALFCSCTDAIPKHRNLYNLFITTLEIHIVEISREFLSVFVLNDNFVYNNLRKLFKAVSASNVDEALKTTVESFKNSLTTTFLWDFRYLDDEDDDKPPIET